MNKLLIAMAVAGLVGTASLASANPAHHAEGATGSSPAAPMKCPKHHHQHARGHNKACKHGGTGMQPMQGGHDMMGGMDHAQMQKHMQQMHGSMGGSTMAGGMADHDHPTASPTPAAPK